MLIRPFTETDTESVVALWEASGLTRPWNDPVVSLGKRLIPDA